MSVKDEGRIFTFYSYKGGTGRTMALANVAWILASQGKRVLAIDWDLEAPGLHRYFAPFLFDPLLSETDGLMEFLTRYVVNVTKEPQSGMKSEEIWYHRYADFKRYAEPLQWRFPDNGCIDLVGSGRQNSSYGALVNGFDWDGFYRQFGGGAFLDEAIRQMKAAYDFVLIDSRTGISDTSGICSVHLPDALVVFYTLNNQSIEGASSVAAHVSMSRQRRPTEPFRVFSMATRVELAEKDKLEARRLFAQERFSSFLETLPELDDRQRHDYWGRMEVLYDPYYAYDEILATIADQPGHTNSVLAAFERLTSYLTKGQVARLGEMSDSKRREALDLYARLGTTKAAPNVTPKQKSQEWDIFISASESDRKQAERLFYLLESSYKVFYASESMEPGTAWEPGIREAIDKSRAMIVLFSEKSVKHKSKWMSEEILAARLRKQRDPSFRLIPLQLDSNAIPSVDFLNEYQWISVQDGDIQKVALQIRRILGTPDMDDPDREHSVRIKAELEHALEGKYRFEKRSRKARLMLIMLLGLLIISINVTFFAYKSRNVNLASLDAIMLTAASYEVRSYDKRLSLVFARTAVLTKETPRTIAVLRNALQVVVDPKIVAEMNVAKMILRSEEIVPRDLTAQEKERYLID